MVEMLGVMAARWEGRNSGPIFHRRPSGDKRAPG